MAGFLTQNQGWAMTEKHIIEWIDEQVPKTGFEQNFFKDMKRSIHRCFEENRSGKAVKFVDLQTGK